MIIPAIDIKDGKCVRLTQGRMDELTVYSDNPEQVARRWASAGAELIHLVDLDGAIAGSPGNYEVLRKITEAVRTPVEVGGGIRDMKTAGAYLSMERVKRIIIGTAAYEAPDLLKSLLKEYPGRIAVGIDAMDGLVAIKGWVKVTRERAVDLARRLEGQGVAAIIYTDISRDGMLTGPNVAATKEIAWAVKIPVVASGGISSIRDIESYAGAGIEGVIIGKALYSGNIDLKDAIEVSGRF
ncbi:MAG: 1-(5-phosphoribosyl)-5-[(5-phosphoribosylamino)methylideneamino]imidazole-4-carboxamide isomerase [Deltaproteobacteria bacterium]|nr:1-(5-phosphoribosyl)-5-[(5-phosphoribosylamino)methylideneamino]imidazole-4-carboxamide isomerase [Deltaproteobacteria bacterium]